MSTNEEKILQIINHLHFLYPHVKNIALAGGVFANIKVNKRINELSWVKEVFVAPPMGDEGLPLGSALTVYKQFNPDFKPFKLDNAFLGVEFTDQETEEKAILDALNKRGVKQGDAFVSSEDKKWIDDFLSEFQRDKI